MGATYDLTTDIGKVRLLVPDRDVANALFQDEEISAFLAMEGSVKATAALALETIAADEALTQKSIQILDIKMDGPAVARSLLERAARLRRQVADEEAATEGAAFDVAEMVFDPFSLRERVYKESLRNG